MINTRPCTRSRQSHAVETLEVSTWNISQNVETASLKVIAQETKHTKPKFQGFSGPDFFNANGETFVVRTTRTSKGNNQLYMLL